METERQRKRRLRELHENGLILATRCDAHGKSDDDIRLIIKTLREVLQDRQLRTQEQRL